VLDEVLKALIDCYPGLGAQTLTGHEHIAPGRKTDPGPKFDWHRVRQSLANRDIIA
jgi:AmpD protein